ncbi:PAS domain-containing protein [Chitinophaga pendula]|uniref:PAS domain-containing sensor histidine kinase n=1 Tax=Chitinophaga TaxID=79328 RepID=UPI000BB05323|nr:MULTISPECIES: PAS domain-containing protein [Chitinophaga]ASZ13655.1 hypothetical protein CK934_23225 [Chitinophaga sp. MD30]UCJ08720.1 PAS domain-containing protein [Chitinophaga pendula]
MKKKNAATADGRFELIVQQAPVGITIFKGKDMIVEMANETYLQIVDKKEEELIGRSLYDSLPEVRTFVEPLLDKVYNTGVSHYGFEFPVILNRYGQSELTYFNFVYQALKDAEGAIFGVFVVANEVTTLVRVKQSIEESERQFRNMVMQSPIAMTIFRGPDHIIELANTTLLKNIWRKTEEEVMGKKALEVFPELKTQKYPALLQKVLNTGITHRESESLAIVGEESFYLDFEYAPLRDTEGNISGVMITVYDVTEKVVARQNVEETKERLRLAVEATGLASWDLDLRDMSIQHAPRLVEILGYPAGTALTHQQMRNSVIPEDLENIVLKAQEEAMTSGIYQYEARIILPDNTIAWIKTQGKVIYDEHKVPFKIIGTLRDITEEKAFSQALERQVQERTKELAVQNETLAKMNAELKSFAYVSSHDLQEPLRKIRIFSERILETEIDQLSAKGKDYFSRIEKATVTMQTLIKDLLVYSRTSNTERTFEKRNIDDLLNEVREQLSEELEEKNATINATPLGIAAIIPFQFKQLLINLISNSLKFCRPGIAPVININHQVVKATAVPGTTTAIEQDYYHLTITDNGIGFDNEFREKIFEIFQRLNQKEKFEGTGIGLAIVKKIVENHQGIISAQGEKDNGARFDIYFPIDPHR